MEEEAWRSEALCRGEDTRDWFPNDTVGVEIAKKICATCPVRQECLDFALDGGIDFGVWGGTSVRERRRLRRQMHMHKPRLPTTRGRRVA